MSGKRKRNIATDAAIEKILFEAADDSRSKLEDADDRDCEDTVNRDEVEEVDTQDNAKCN